MNVDVLASMSSSELPSTARVVTAKITSASSDVAMLSCADGTEAMMPVSEFYPDLRWRDGDLYTVLLIDSAGRLPIASVVRTELVEMLYASVSPELRDGSVRIMGVARAPGVRSKVAVASTGTAEVDPVAALLGRGANRVRFVAKRLAGERIDVVAWHPDPATFLANALAPAEIDRVVIDGRDAIAYAPPHQMSAAVGRGGLNSVLAGRLVDLMVTVDQA